MHSFEMLTKISANRSGPTACEELAFNSLPASLTPDWKGLHYLTCANQVQLDKNNTPRRPERRHHVQLQPLRRLSLLSTQCLSRLAILCEELWLATPDGGLCASLYAASEVTANVGDGTSVTISEETDYPFDELITSKARHAAASKVSAAAAHPALVRQTRRSNQRQEHFSEKRSRTPTPSSNSEWNDSDTVSLRLPMKISLRRWAKKPKCRSVDVGPLTLSLKIGGEMGPLR